nr:eIF-2-alpha kinase activator gcn1-like isoform X2 [Ipomoea trifida]
MARRQCGWAMVALEHPLPTEVNAFPVSWRCKAAGGSDGSTSGRLEQRLTMAELGNGAKFCEHLLDFAKKAAEAVVTIIDEEGIESLLSELLKGVGDIQAC